jgi:pimeloyl-ACP methyl ester carboxylesterase
MPATLGKLSLNGHVTSGLPDPSQLSCPARLVTETSAVADIWLRTVAASFLTVAGAPWALSWAASRERAAHELYANLAEEAGGDAARVFPRPDVRVNVQADRSAPVPFRRRQGRVEMVHFESPFVTVNPELRDRYAGHRPNRTAWAQHWRHKDGPRPTLCVIHGFMASPYWFNSAFFSLPWFYHHGYDVLLYTLPFHGRRQDRISPFSGHGFFANGFAHVNEAMFQAIFDFRLFVDYLEGLGAPMIGVTGLSLGGYTTALLAAVENRLHLAIPNCAVTDMGRLVMEDWWPTGQVLSLIAPRRGLPVDLLLRSLSVHSPLTYPRALPRERLFIVGGLGDRLAPPEQSSWLWEHWDRCKLHWFPGNHTLHVNRGAYLREMGRFFQATGFSELRQVA